MKNFLKYKFSLLLLTCTLLFSCVEQIDIKSISTVERSLVVECLITDELKTQEVILTKTFSFEEDKPMPETNASITVVGDNSKAYNFREISPGNYISDTPFLAEPNVSYHLEIQTNDGTNYISKRTVLTQKTKIEKVYASRETNMEGTDGISIFVDSKDPTGNSRYYRYEYEETYKIIAPYYTVLDFVITQDFFPYQHAILQKTTEQQICFNTDYSNSIIQTETSNLTQDVVSKFMVRFIPQYNPIISYRYSILVKQYVQSMEAYTYFNTLKKISSSQSLLSQKQPGFIAGNMYCEDKPNNKVIGFFEVSSVSTKRMFFNYSEYFIDEPLPHYFATCDFIAPTIYPFPPDSEDPPLLYKLIKSEDVKFYKFNEGSISKPYVTVTAACGDCTKLGTNVKPDFWE